MRFALASALFVMCLPPAIGAAGQTWRIVSTSGVVRVTSSDAPIGPARVGADIGAGAIVATGQNGLVVLDGPGGQITITADSRVSLRPPPGGIAGVFQDAGAALFKIEKRATPYFRVETPTMAAIVKGTTFAIEASPDEARLRVLEGLVEVRAHGSGASADVPAGTTARVRRGAPSIDLQRDSEATAFAPIAADPNERDFLRPAPSPAPSSTPAASTAAPELGASEGPSQSGTETAQSSFVGSVVTTELRSFAAATDFLSPGISTRQPDGANANQRSSAPEPPKSAPPPPENVGPPRSPGAEASDAGLTERHLGGASRRGASRTDEVAQVRDQPPRSLDEERDRQGKAKEKPEASTGDQERRDVDRDAKGGRGESGGAKYDERTPKGEPKGEPDDKGPAHSGEPEKPPSSPRMPTGSDWNSDLPNGNAPPGDARGSGASPRAPTTRGDPQPEAGPSEKGPSRPGQPGRRNPKEGGS